MDVLFWLLMYVLAGLTYAIFVLYVNWNDIVVPVRRAKLPTSVNFGVWSFFTVSTCITWPLRLYHRIRRAWCGRKVPSHIRVLVERLTAESVYARMMEVRRAMYPHEPE